MKKCVIILLFIFSSCATEKEEKDREIENSSVEKSNLPFNKVRMQDSSSTKTSIKIDTSIIDPLPTLEEWNLESLKVTYLSVDSFYIDVDNDMVLDSIYLFQIEQLENDPGDYHKIKISRSNGNQFEVVNPGGWVQNNLPNLGENNLKKSLVRLIKSEGLCFLICQGYNYASDPPFITVMDFSKSETRIIFNQEFSVLEFNPQPKTLFKGTKGLFGAGVQEPLKIFELAIVDNIFQLTVLTDN